MKTLKEKLAHAFYIEPARVSTGEDSLSPVLERFAHKVVSRRMETPALLFLETMTPLNFLGSQFMFAMKPFVTVFFNGDEYEQVAAELENRNTVRRLASRIEYLASRKTS